jgi:metal-responsive CopG/Arc/MetJ family transcriptional regulator
MVEVYTVRISDDLHAKVEEAIQKANQIRSDFCREAIEEKVARILGSEYKGTTITPVVNTSEYDAIQTKYAEIQTKYAEVERDRDIAKAILEAKEAHIKDLQFQAGLFASELSLLTSKIPMLPAPEAVSAKKKWHWWQRLRT